MGLAITAAVLLLYRIELPWFSHTLDRLDALVYDQRLAWSIETRPNDPRVVIVDIDEKSLQREGQWPWPRDKLGNLVESLFRQGAVIVVFDIFFPEAERNSADLVLSRLRESGVDLTGTEKTITKHRLLFDNNLNFAKVLTQHETILGFHLAFNSEEPIGELPHPVPLTEKSKALNTSVTRASSYTANIPELKNISGGFITLSGNDNIDGILRRAPMLMRFDNALYPSLSLEALRQYQLIEKIGLVTETIDGKLTLEGIALGEKVIPTDPQGRVLIPYRGRTGSFSYFSATDFLHEEKSAAIELNGAIALIGTTAPGLFDLRATPVDSVYPGVEVHANLISGVLDELIATEPSWAVAANLLLLLVTGLFASLLMPRLSSLRIFTVSIFLAALLISTNIWFWSEMRLALDLALILILLGMLAFANMAFGYLFESRGRHRLEDMFGQYVPKELVQAMNEDPDNYSFDGDTRELSVLFSDIRSFTSMSESLDATEVKTLLNEYFTPMTRIIFENRGTIDKYVGDMIMAFWGAPLQDDDHAYNAVCAAMLMQKESERLKAEFKAKNLPEVAIGIGINTGAMSVGDMGSVYRRSYTVLGDAVNLGSRIESLTKFYQVGLAIGETTKKALRDRIICRELDLVRVKGKLEAVKVYQPICPASEATEKLLKELAEYETALETFRNADWYNAERLFGTLHISLPEVYIYKLYLQRLSVLKRNPPPDDWDGVMVREEK